MKKEGQGYLAMLSFQLVLIVYPFRRGGAGLLRTV